MLCSVSYAPKKMLSLILVVEQKHSDYCASTETHRTHFLWLFEKKDRVKWHETGLFFPLRFSMTRGAGEGAREGDLWFWLISVSHLIREECRWSKGSSRLSHNHRQICCTCIPTWPAFVRLKHMYTKEGHSRDMTDRMTQWGRQMKMMKGRKTGKEEARERERQV